VPKPKSTCSLDRYSQNVTIENDVKHIIDQEVGSIIIFAKSAILEIFYFAPGGFQCTAKGIFTPKNLKLGKISTKKSTFFYYVFEINELYQFK